MDYTYPKLVTSGTEHFLYFINQDTVEELNSYQLKNIELVFDYNENNEMIGLEIISLSYFLGKNILAGIHWKKNVLEYSYDQDSDSFYIHLSPDRHSPMQRAYSGVAILDKYGCLVGVKF